MINNQKNHSPLFKCNMQTAKETCSLPAISDFYESLELVGGSVFYLFANKSFTSVQKKVTRIDERSDALKRKIIFFAKGFDCDRLLSFLADLTEEEIQSVGLDFFFITSKKISKNQSIASFAKLLNILFRAFGFNEALVKNFFFNNRDADEVFSLLSYLRRFCDSEDVSKAILVACERLSLQGKIKEVFRLIESEKSSIEVTDSSSKTAYKTIVNVIQGILMNNGDTSGIFSLFEDMISFGFQFNLIICNKVLDLFNRNLVCDGSVEKLIAFMADQNISSNIITFNTLIDFYSMSGQFNKAYDLFKNLEKEGMEADSYTFSILIKGIKSMREPSLEIIEEVLAEVTQDNKCFDIIIFNSILDVLVSLNLIDKVNEFFNKMKKDESIVPDLITFNTLIKGCCRNKDFTNAVKYFKEMKSHSLKPSRITYNSLMDLAVKTEKLKEALLILEEMQKDNIVADSYTYSIILNGLKINESKISLVKAILSKIRDIIENKETKLDEILFNSTLDVCSKYEIYNSMEYFHKLMSANKVKESFVTYNILIKAYTKQNNFSKVNSALARMVSLNMQLGEVTYGSVLDACAKSGQMKECLRMYEILSNARLNMNSIVFTTILKGFIKKEDFDGAITFFNSVKHNTELSGMIITYNCALDVLVRKKNISAAIELFSEINEHFSVDVISYSTMIKGLCQANKKNEAFSYIKDLIEFDGKVDVSVMNLFLDSCATPSDYHIGIKCYQYIMMKNIKPNEITFGIMVKIYGFSKELHKAFDLLDLMRVFEITPSIIIYTNLIHISFYNRNPKKADIAYALIKKDGLKGDRLLYSKLIDGMMRFKDHNKVVKYVGLTAKDNCCLKKPTLDRLFEYFKNDEQVTEKLNKIAKTNFVRTTETKEERIKRLESNKAPAYRKNPKKYNKGFKDSENTKTEKKKPMRSGINVNRGFKARGSITNVYKGFNAKTVGGRNAEGFGKKPLALFNFRNKN